MSSRKKSREKGFQTPSETQVLHFLFWGVFCVKSDRVRLFIFHELYTHVQSLYNFFLSAWQLCSSLIILIVENGRCDGTSCTLVVVVFCCCCCCCCLACQKLLFLMTQQTVLLVTRHKLCCNFDCSARSRSTKYFWEELYVQNFQCIHHFLVLVSLVFHGHSRFFLIFFKFYARGK